MQVWCKGRHVGDLLVSVASHMRSIVLRTMTVPDFGTTKLTDEINIPIINEINIPIVRRNAAISDHVVSNSRIDVSTILASINVPIGDPTLKRFIDIESHSTRYSWNVADVTPELLDAIFDMREFEPC